MGGRANEKVTNWLQKIPTSLRARPLSGGCGIFKRDVHPSAYSNRVGVLVQIYIPRHADRAVLGGPLFLLSQVAPSFTSRLRVLSGLTSLTWASDSAVALPPLCDYIIAQKCWNVKHFFQLFLASVPKRQNSESDSAASLWD